jgi:hypothetical protein
MQSTTIDERLRGVNMRMQQQRADIKKNSHVRLHWERAHPISTIFSPINDVFHDVALG